MTLRMDKRWSFIIKFLLLFSLFYFGTLAVIGFAAPGNHYIPFVEKYLDYISWIKWSLLGATKLFLSLLGIPSYIEPGFTMKGEYGYRILLAMDCVGYGVYSFWAAYVIAGDSRLKTKIIWTLGGLFLLWLINVLRISAVLVAINNSWKMPLGIDHHTWFNIVAYTAIFLMMWWFEKKVAFKQINKPNSNNGH